jgi:hypothetical protein
MRLGGEIPFAWITDSTRWMRKPRTYSSIADMLERTVIYRRALRDSSPVYVEIWLEKDALAGVLYDVTAVYDVPLTLRQLGPELWSPADIRQAYHQQHRHTDHVFFQGGPSEPGTRPDETGENQGSVQTTPDLKAIPVRIEGKMKMKVQDDQIQHAQAPDNGANPPALLA